MRESSSEVSFQAESSKAHTERSPGQRRGRGAVLCCPCTILMDKAFLTAFGPSRAHLGQKHSYPCASLDKSTHPRNTQHTKSVNNNRGGFFCNFFGQVSDTYKPFEKSILNEKAKVHMFYKKAKSLRV